MIIDIVCGLLVALSFYLGYTKGIIKSVFAILSIIIGLLATLKFSYFVIGILEKFLTIDPRWVIILGFILTFLLVLIGIRALGKLLEKVLQTAHINFINQLAGGVISTLIALIIYSSILGFLDRINLIKPELKLDSASYSILETIPEKSKSLVEASKPFFSEFWAKTQDAINKAEKNKPQ
jgi:membrane protein required for colicin V production